MVHRIDEDEWGSAKLLDIICYLLKERLFVILWNMQSGQLEYEDARYSAMDPTNLGLDISYC